MVRDGDIHKVLYNKVVHKEFSDESKQNCLDTSTRVAVSTFLRQMVSGVDNAMDPNTIFAKSRQQGYDAIEMESEEETLHSTYLQVGHKESYDEIIAIEQDPDFKAWIDPMLIEDIKKFYSND